MISQVFIQNAYKILSMFSLSPGSRFSRKEIKEMTRLNNVPLDSAISTLFSSGILTRERNLYSLDFENRATKNILELITKERLKAKELPFDIYLTLVDIVSFLSAYKDVHAYLFGSYSKLIYNEKSDIDIAVIATKSLDKKNLQRRIEKLEIVYNKKIELHLFDKDTFYKNRKDPLVRDIIKNGIMLI